MNESNKIKLLIELEPVIEFNVKRLFNYRLKDYEDLMQEARMIVFNALDKYTEDKGSLSTFCQILIKNNLVCLTMKEYRNWDKVDFNEEKLELIADDQSTLIKEAYLNLHYLLEYHKEQFTKAELTFGKLLEQGKSFKEIEAIMGINTNHRVQLAYQFKKKARLLVEEE